MMVPQPIPLEMLLGGLQPRLGWWWTEPWGAPWDVMARSVLHTVGSPFYPHDRLLQTQVSKILLPRLLRLVCVYMQSC